MADVCVCTYVCCVYVCEYVCVFTFLYFPNFLPKASMTLVIKGDQEIESLNTLKNIRYRMEKQGFPGGVAVKNPPANAGDTGSSPGPGRSHMLRSN